MSWIVIYWFLLHHNWKSFCSHYDLWHTEQPYQWFDITFQSHSFELLLQLLYSKFLNLCSHAWIQLWSLNSRTITGCWLLLSFSCFLFVKMFPLFFPPLFIIFAVFLSFHWVFWWKGSKEWRIFVFYFLFRCLIHDHVSTILQTSLTAAGCYLCPAPGSRGTKALVCSSIDGPLPSKLELFQIHSDGEQRHCVPDVEQILEDAKSYSNHLIQDASDKLLLSMTSDSVLTEAKRFNMLSESTYKNILLLQREEIKRFKLDSEVTSDSQLMHAVECVGTYPSIPLQPGQVCYFMNRFFLTWKLIKENGSRAFPREVHNDGGLGEDSWNEYCSSCLVGDEMVAELRHMIESDWLYLAKLSKGLSSGNLPLEREFIDEKTGQKVEKTNLCAEYGRLSAKRAILSLKSIAVAARRSLPVLVSSHGQLLSIPVS